ncbi:MerR family transcriptional regulator [Aquihabitans sp. G128]|uniref:MerR family transcriptional regulator n=1 Tax=Aquihabitans sp. G128 TaxID=2849779 RepID=UPI001C243BE4|nr:MerR family transcriptional regulator [Aquihabitans sp. G128]QXC60984.1 MerR family transcriptional regulator [Aquihabitans sp. G128]
MGTELTIDELAAQVGMTVRNIRAHQSRGLLHPPRIVGRTGYYGDSHVGRLSQIRELQDEGLNLAAIARVLTDGTLTAVATGPFADVAPEYGKPGEVAERLGLELDDPVIQRSVDMGLITPEGDRIRIELPRLVAIAEQLRDVGVPLDAMLDVVEVVREASTQVARSFMKLADEHLVAKVVAESGGDLDQLTEAVERLHTQASGAIDVLFNQAMSAEIRTYLAPPSDDGDLEA